MWQVRFTIRFDLPFARADIRLKLEPSPISIELTSNSSMSAPSLCSAFAIADSRTFFSILADFFGLNCNKLIALPTFNPLIWSATNRHFWAETLTVFNFAMVAILLALYA
jgi:hypothetical protein